MLSAFLKYRVGAIAVLETGIPAPKVRTAEVSVLVPEVAVTPP